MKESKIDFGKANLGFDEPPVPMHYGMPLMAMSYGAPPMAPPMMCGGPPMAQTMMGYSAAPQMMSRSRRAPAPMAAAPMMAKMAVAPRSTTLARAESFEEDEDECLEECDGGIMESSDVLRADLEMCEDEEEEESKQFESFATIPMSKSMQRSASPASPGAI